MDDASYGRGITTMGKTPQCRFRIIILKFWERFLLACDTYVWFLFVVVFGLTDDGPVRDKIEGLTTRE